jgi:hypothetical protein
VSNPSKALGVLASLGVSVLLGACSMTVTLNADQLEQAVATGISQQTGLTMTVTCPDDRPMQQGDVFTCTATAADGTSRTVEVTQTDAAGNVTWRLI